AGIQILSLGWGLLTIPKELSSSRATEAITSAGQEGVFFIFFLIFSITLIGAAVGGMQAIIRKGDTLLSDLFWIFVILLIWSLARLCHSPALLEPFFPTILNDWVTTKASPNTFYGILFVLFLTFAILKWKKSLKNIAPFVILLLIPLFLSFDLNRSSE